MSDRRKRPGRARMRAWMSVNLVVLLAVTGWVYEAANSKSANADKAAALPSGTATATPGGSAAPHSASASPSPAAGKPSYPTVQTVEGEKGRYFGVSADEIPWSATAYTALGKTAGAAPNLIEYYVNWTQGFDSKAVFDAYSEGALPLITWEPFAGSPTKKVDVNVPAYSLSVVASGRYDAYVKGFAQAVAQAGVPVAIRFAHEMNGDWYPWSVNVNGNSAADYVAAWKHVWTVFQQAGATNVIWVWAPNILRGAEELSLASLYPGDQYVDWIGLTGYDVHEATAATLFKPTLRKIRAFTAKKLLITETGAQPGPQKAAWTQDFLDWLTQQPDVIGFVWNETSEERGANTRWGFDADPATLAAFRAGIGKVGLADVPSF